MAIRVADLHCDTPLEIRGGADLVAGHPEGHVDLERLERGGVGLAVFACYVAPTLPTGLAFAEAEDLLDRIDGACAASGGRIAKAETAADVDRALASGAATAVVAAVENGHAIEEDLGKLERLRLRGVRYLTLTHSRNLSWAASSGETSCPFEGLTPFGEKVVHAMNEMGIVVDVSHAHATTVRDVARIARRPFIASHSAAAALCPIARNLDDDGIRAVAASGGVVGINFFPGFLDPAYAEAQESRIGDLFEVLEEVEREHGGDAPRRLEEGRKLAASMRERMAAVRPGIGRIADHVLHVVRLVGDDHAAFGSDFDGVPDLPGEVPDCSAFPRILRDLRARGLSEASVEKIAWRNFRRVLDENR